MSSAAMLIEQARVEGIVLLYRQEGDGPSLWAWSPSYVQKSVRRRYTAQFRERYADVCTLLKLAALEHA
jgi:hypothetical protein